MKKILIIRMSSLGDVLIASPLIRALRRHFLEAQIDFVVRKEYAEVIRYNPHLTNVIEFDISTGLVGLWKLRKKIWQTKYDIILDIHRNFRSRLICWSFKNLFNRKTIIRTVRKNYFLRFLLVYFKLNLYKKFHGCVIKVWQKYLQVAQPLGIKPDNLGIELFLNDEAESVVQILFTEIKSRKWKIVIAPGAKHFTKRWPAEYFADLIRKFFTKYKSQIILVGGPEDREVTAQVTSTIPDIPVLSMVGNYTILQTAAIIKHANLFIGNDSGLTHVAAAFKIPTVAIFGSTVEEFGFFPENPNAIVVENNRLNCRPCSHIGRAKCPKKHFKCMREITPENVFDKALDLLLHTELHT